MGDYSRLRIHFAESDLSTAERTFMERLWREYFGPARALWAEADGYSRSIELQQQVHARSGLRGTAEDWRFVSAEERDGQKNTICCWKACLPC